MHRKLNYLPRNRSASVPFMLRHTPHSLTTSSRLIPSRSQALSSKDTISPVTAAQTINLTGQWRRLPGQSMSQYERALDLWQLSYFQKTAAKLIEDLEIQQSGSTFIVSMFVTAIPQFKISESYSLYGPSKVPRRDMRGEALATTTTTLNGIKLVATFGDPLPGRLEEKYELVGGQLHVSSVATIQGRSVESKLVYVKA